MTEVARVEQELLFGLPLLRRPKRDPVKPTREPFDDAEELKRTEGLPDEGVRAGRVAVRLCAVVGTRQEDDRDVPRPRACLELAAVHEAVHARHADVEEDRIGSRSFEDPVRLGRALRLVHDDVDHLERRPNEGSKRGIVVYE
ncbi:MAG: hypothetical protein M3265_01950 [Actinomycetota bacterium]|nr:hypothetical protein [Actinomycetota bacterium]